MVATADRSPARYTFELKLAEVPSGPLNSELELLAATRPHIECDRAGGGPVSYECRRGFLRSRLLPARLRSRTTRMAEAWSMALTTSLRGRPGGRRVRRKASRSSGRMAHTIPTLIPYSRCRQGIHCLRRSMAEGVPGRKDDSPQRDHERPLGRPGDLDGRHAHRPAREPDWHHCADLQEGRRLRRPAPPGRERKDCGGPHLLRPARPDDPARSHPCAGRGLTTDALDPAPVGGRVLLLFLLGLR